MVKLWYPIETMLQLEETMVNHIIPWYFMVFLGIYYTKYCGKIMVFLVSHSNHGTTSYYRKL